MSTKLPLLAAAALALLLTPSAAAGLTEVPLPQNLAHPHAAWWDVDAQRLWFTTAVPPAVAQFDPANGTFRHWPIPAALGAGGENTLTVGASPIGGRLWDVLGDGRGHVYVTDGAAGAVLRLTPAEDAWHVVSLGDRNATPLFLARDSGGAVWASELLGNRVTRVDPVTLEAERIEIPLANAGPTGLAFDGDGKLWVALSYGKRLVRYDPVTREWDLNAGPQGLAAPVGLVLRDGTGWVSEHGMNRLQSLDLRAGTRGPLSVPLAPTPLYPTANPMGLALDEERGALWVAVHTGNRITRIDLSTPDRVVEYKLPYRIPADVHAITVDNEGRAWSVSGTMHRILRLDPEPYPAVHPDVTGPLRVEKGTEQRVSFPLLGATGAGRANVTGEFFVDDFGLLVTASEVSPDGRTGTLTLKAFGDVQPGDHRLTVCADLPEALSCQVVTVQVYLPAAAPKTPAPGATAALAALALVAGVLARRRAQRA